jgi:nitrilase
VNWSALRATEQKVRRGDGTRENLEQVARDTGVFIVVGVVEKSGGSLYCSALYIDPQRGCIGKRRKVQPTGSERLIWATGSPETLKAVVAEIKGVRVVMGAVICWENYMPLLRYALYSQNVNLWLAPTADARDGWLSLMRTVGTEGRCFVVSSCMCVQKGQEAKWIDDQGGEESQDRHADATQGRSRDARRRKSIVTKTDDNHEITWPPASSPSPARRRSSVTIAEGPHELRLPIINSSAEQTPQTPKPARKGSDVEDKPSAPPPQGWSCRGGSCIIAPNGDVLTGPLWEEPDGMLIQEVDFEDCIRGRLDFDAGGSYSRNDSFELKVKGLSLDPPV